MAQIPCLNCYRKHIATAMVFEDEAGIGEDYPLHKWLAVGELHAAEKEIYRQYPVLAEMTRAQRIMYMNDDIPINTLELIELACQLEEKENSEAKTDVDMKTINPEENQELLLGQS